MTNLLKIPTWADEENIHAVVETPRGSTLQAGLRSGPARVHARQAFDGRPHLSVRLGIYPVD